MRRNLTVALSVCTGLTFAMWCAGTTALGQGQGQPGRSNNAGGVEARVALVDLAYIFKNYTKFSTMSENMKDEVKAREKEIADAQTELKTLMAKKQQINPDTPTHKEIDQKLAQKRAELELMTGNAREYFTRKEASIYHQTYQEVEAAIKKYAQAYGITLVLRASRDEEITPANPQDVIKEVSQQVIFSAPQMDITEQILAMLNPPRTEKGNQPVNKQGTSTGKPATVPSITNKPSTGDVKIKK